MTDKMTPEQRHRCMSHIKGSGTKPELKVRRWLWSHGYRYRLNVKSVPGKPDIVMRTYRTAIFVNGCFWHGHNITPNPKPHPLTPSPKGEGEAYGGGGIDYFIGNSKCCKIPNTNRAFWMEKILRNQERDQENYRVLQENGWQVIIIWECQLTSKRIEHTMRNVELILNNNLLSLYKHRIPIPYPTEEDTPLPLAAESETGF